VIMLALVLTLAADTFQASAAVTAGPGATGTITVPLIIQIDRYTPESARTKMRDALKHGGYPGFLRALRDTAAAGHVEVAGRKVAIRWAEEQPAEGGRRISLVTDEPLYFVGGARKDAKPKAGYEVAVLLLTVDAAGKGEGTVAAAARVKPLDVTGVKIDDYAETPIKITIGR